MAKNTKPKDNELYLEKTNAGTRLCYNFRGTTRFMVLTDEQLAQLKELVKEV